MNIMIKRLGIFTLTIIAGFFVFGGNVFGAGCAGIGSGAEINVGYNGSVMFYEAKNVDLSVLTRIRLDFLNRTDNTTQTRILDIINSGAGSFTPSVGTYIVHAYNSDTLAQLQCNFSEVIVPEAGPPVLPPNLGKDDCKSKVANTWFNNVGDPIAPTAYILFNNTTGLPDSFTLNVLSSSGSVVSSVDVSTPTTNLLIQQPISLAGSDNYTFELVSPFCTEPIKSLNFSFTAIENEAQCNPNADACGSGYKCTRVSDCSSFKNGQCANGGYYCMPDGTPAGSLKPNPVGSIPFSTDPTNIPQLVNLIIKFSVGIAGVVAFFLLAVGSYKFMMSRGDPAAIQSAQETISSAIAGLVLIILAVSIFGIMSGILQIPGIDLGGNSLSIEAPNIPGN